MRLVVLNACYTGALPRRRQGAFTAAATALVIAGIPAVVAMQLIPSSSSAAPSSAASSEPWPPPWRRRRPLPHPGWSLGSQGLPRGTPRGAVEWGREAMHREPHMLKTQEPP